MLLTYDALSWTAPQFCSSLASLSSHLLPNVGLLSPPPRQPVYPPDSFLLVPLLHQLTSVSLGSVPEICIFFKSQAGERTRWASKGSAGKSTWNPGSTMVLHWSRKITDLGLRDIQELLAKRMPQARDWLQNLFLLFQPG